MEIKSASIDDAEIIRKLAYETWPTTYGHIASKSQIEFMLEQSYTLEAIHKQMLTGHSFLLIEKEGIAQGFTSFRCTSELAIFKLEKLYVHPKTQSEGVGRKLLNEVEQRCSALGATRLMLNVNRRNKALHFYQRLGYEIVESIDIPYFDYVLEDYVMGKDLSNANFKL